MKQKVFTTEEILHRLEILYRKLSDEGFHVKANTVGLAIDEIERLRKDKNTGR